MEIQILNNDDYLKILQSKYKMQNIEILGSKWDPLSEDIEGFMGDHYILTLNFKLDGIQKSETFFVKTKTEKTEIQKEMASAFNSYQKEVFLYDILQKEFEKLGYDTEFAPWCYFCKNGETMVMENLQKSGFKLVERNSFFDLEHCKAALKAMAVYHGNSISYEEQKSLEHGKVFRFPEKFGDIFKENLYIPGDKIGLAYQFWQRSKECFFKVVELLSENSEWKNTFRKKLEAFDPSDIFIKELSSRKTCGHGDLWSNNMLFKYSADNLPIHCKLVDFQLVRYFYPSFDALLIIYENTRRKFRDINMTPLLNFYYDCLESTISKNGFNISKILTRKEFFDSVEEIKIAAMFQGAAVRTMVLLPTKILNSAVESGGEGLRDIIFSDERANFLLKAAKTDDVFREIIFDDVYELYENLQNYMK